MEFNEFTFGDVEPTQELYALWCQLHYTEEWTYTEFLESIAMMKREKPQLLVWKMNAIEILKTKSVDDARGYLQDEKAMFSFLMRKSLDNLLEGDEFPEM